MECCHPCKTDVPKIPVAPEMVVCWSYVRDFVKVIVNQYVQVRKAQAMMDPPWF